MRDETPDVRVKPLRIAASLLTCTIFTALLAYKAMGRKGKNLPNMQAGTYSSTTVREFHTVPF